MSDRPGIIYGTLRLWQRARVHPRGRGIVAGLLLIVAPSLMIGAIRRLPYALFGTMLRPGGPNTFHSGNDLEYLEIIEWAMVAAGVVLVLFACTPRSVIAWSARLWDGRHPLLGAALALVAPLALFAGLMLIGISPAVPIVVTAALVILGIVRWINRRDFPGEPPPTDAP